jgi:hypothetical protein
MHLDHALGARLGVKAVDVLGDHALEHPPALELRERPVGGVGLLAVEGLEARPVEVPEAPRVAVEGVDVGDLHRVDLLPQALPGRAEVRNSRGHRDAGAR